MLKPILSEGERVESIEVVSINVEKNEVTIRNGGVITNLTFKIAKSTPGPAAPGALPPPVPGSVPPPIPPQTTLNNYGTGRGGGVQMGGGAPVASPAGLGGNPNAGFGGANASAMTAGGDSAFRSIPSRNIRANQQTQLSAEESVLRLEENRLENKRQMDQNPLVRLPPLPPTLLTPPENQGDDGQSGLPAFPSNTGGPKRWKSRPINLPPPPGG